MAIWDSYERHVQYDIDPNLPMTADHARVAAGPPTVAGIAGEGLSAQVSSSSLVYPIGALQGFAMGQNRFWLRALELGSQYGYMIPGRWAASVTMNRIYINGPSLMRALYAYKGLSGPAAEGWAAKLGLSVGDINLDVNISPGRSEAFFNLMSEYFQTPVGLMAVMGDREGVPETGLYLEECGITAHQMALAAENVIVSEAVTLIPNALVPVKVNGASANVSISVQTNLGSLTVGNKRLTDFGS